jgi:pimeloyl-ACP methyl ester carboxylesterase
MGNQRRQCSARVTRDKMLLLTCGSVAGFMAGAMIWQRLRSKQRRAGFGEIYSDVPADQREQLMIFRINHRYKELEVAGTLWRYISCGDGENALLFLPGGFLPADMWFHAILRLEDDYRIIAPDSFTLQGVYGMDSVCEALVRILDAEGVVKASAVGLSAGGGVAQYLVQEYPDRVEHLVFSHCSEIERDAGLEARLKRLLLLVKLMPLSIIRRILMKTTTGSVPPSSRWIAFHNAYFREANLNLTKEMIAGFLQESVELRKRFIFKPELSDAGPGEILILASSDDNVALASLAKLRARYPSARTHVFEQGGHHTFMFFPEAYTAVLKAFLDDVTVVEGA